MADALSAWHKAGASGGDLNFWRPYVDEFDSPQAYAWVIEALLEKRDLSAAMALLVHWLGQADQVRLEEGPHSFHGLAVRWMQMVLGGCQSAGTACSGKGTPKQHRPSDGGRRIVRRFFDFLEANAETYWELPRLERDRADRRSPTTTKPRRSRATGSSSDDDDDDDNLYRAAYDEMVYRDSTADGVEGSTLESGGLATDTEFETESNRLAGRLAFLATIARMWKQVAVAQLVALPRQAAGQ